MESSLCTTAEEITRRTTWIIKNFDSLMEDSSQKGLRHPTLEIHFNKWERTSTKWNICCWPNIVDRSGIRNMRLTVGLGLLPPNSCHIETALNVAVAAKLLDSAGNKVPLKEVTGSYKTGSGSNVLDVDVDHEKLKSSAEKLMPGGTLTIYVEIKILPSVATVVHGSLQNVDPAQPAQALTPKNIFEDMVDNFVNLKLGSLLIVFQDGEQNCHAFPLAARNVFGGKLKFVYSQTNIYTNTVLWCCVFCKPGIRCFVDLWIRTRDKFFSISDPGSPTHISYWLVTIIWVKYT